MPDRRATGRPCRRKNVSRSRNAAGQRRDEAAVLAKATPPPPPAWRGYNGASCYGLLPLSPCLSGEHRGSGVDGGHSSVSREQHLLPGHSQFGKPVPVPNADVGKVVGRGHCSYENDMGAFITSAKDIFSTRLEDC
ncbi:hypothetical protein AAFF_G00173600 [Aldrovandia affinis]|uniref:Uncharacterized protein n=1 Tax=Aldrovandia affinis TaxID=143900 RepID=A0AAD7SYX7_9TELE|nr:hypothetical protein AAFF_G00173600 [Aldrovandia affinis]